MKDSSTLFAANIRRYRSLRRQTQAQLAEMAGIISNYLSQIEGGNQFPSPPVIDSLAVALKVQVFELFVDFESVGSVDGALASSVRQFLADIANQVSAFSDTIK